MSLLRSQKRCNWRRPRVAHFAKIPKIIFYIDFSHCYTPKDFTKWKILKFFWNLLWGQADCSFILWFIVWSIFGNTFLKKVKNKSLSKLAVKVMRDRGGPYLSFDTQRSKFDLVLCPGWANPSHKFGHD